MKPVRLRLTPALIEATVPTAAEFTLHDMNCPGLGLRVQPSGAKSWISIRRDAGKSRRLTLGRWPGMSLDAARAAVHRQDETGASAPPQNAPIYRAARKDRGHPNLR